ncbi:MAG: DUF47 family protein [Candidatus Sericytochromatia bacterium]|nr:DUF47 family protein [Candidatus Sericytochromatia bacterium]
MIAALMPRERKFFDLLELSARQMHRRAECVAKLLREPDDALVAEINAERRAMHGDHTVTHQIIDQLNATFVTPIDREDIHALAFKLDDIVNTILLLGDRFALYDVRPTGEMIELVDLLVRCANEIVVGLEKLRTPRLMREIQAHCDHIYKLAIDADDLMRRALSSLYGEPVLQPADVVDLLKRREVLDLIKKSVERCEVIGDLLHGVAVKHA